MFWLWGIVSSVLKLENFTAYEGPHGWPVIWFSLPQQKLLSLRSCVAPDGRPRWSLCSPWQDFSLGPRLLTTSPWNLRRLPLHIHDCSSSSPSAPLCSCLLGQAHPWWFSLIPLRSALSGRLNPAWSATTHELLPSLSESILISVFWTFLLEWLTGTLNSGYLNLTHFLANDLWLPVPLQSSPQRFCQLFHFGGWLPWKPDTCDSSSSLNNPVV